jgi:tRNA(Arg) A34 adenosine deaminase TadA
MSPFSEQITPDLIQRLNVAADRTFDLIVSDTRERGLRTQGVMNHNGFDYPVAAMVLDKTGSMELGKDVSTDVLTGIPTAHAETNALKKAESGIFEPRIVVSTMESCWMCQTSITNRIGHGGLIAYVTSRNTAENLGHVKARPTTDDDAVEGVQSLQLTHPRLQKKGLVLLEEHVTRDPRTGWTDINWRPLRKRFSEIDEEYPLGYPRLG